MLRSNTESKRQPVGSKPRATPGFLHGSGSLSSRGRPCAVSTGDALP
jgi:hypothetical protein